MKQLSIETDDGIAPAYEYGSGPSVLLFIDGLGMRPAMHRLAEHLGNSGYRVLMPDLFYRLGAYEAPDPAKLFSDPAVRGDWWKRIGGTTADRLLADTRAYLARLDGPVGVTGYCMGGRLALLAAATYAERIVAAAAYHPGGLVTDAPDSPHLSLGKIKGAVYVGGAMEDSSFTDEARRTVDDALTAAGVDHTVDLYPAKHGWVPSDTPVHDALQTERHWETLLQLFGRQLLH
jgi:carboxymethylenebutenolidase